RSVRTSVGVPWERSQPPLVPLLIVTGHVAGRRGPHVERHHLVAHQIECRVSRIRRDQGQERERTLDDAVFLPCGEERLAAGRRQPVLPKRAERQCGGTWR